LRNGRIGSLNLKQTPKQVENRLRERGFEAVMQNGSEGSGGEQPPQ